MSFEKRDWRDKDGNPVSRYREMDELLFSFCTGIPVASLRSQRSRADDYKRTEIIPFIKRGRSIRYTLFQYEQHLEAVTYGSIRKKAG